VSGTKLLVLGSSVISAAGALSAGKAQSDMANYNAAVAAITGLA
jgi:hypothetical protein